MTQKKFFAAITVTMMALLAFILPALAPKGSTVHPAIAAAAAPTAQVTATEETQAAELQAVDAFAPLTAVTPPPVVQATPVAATGTLPSLAEFANSLGGGQASQPAGVYAEGLFALEIVRQPGKNITYIDSAAETTTLYQLAEDAGSVGLLAHNYLSGADFDELEVGQALYLVRGDGRVIEYRITGTRSYQALNSTDPYANLVRLDTGTELTSSDVFGENYLPGTLVLQTCIEQNGDWSWGRLFVSAEPVS